MKINDLNVEDIQKIDVEKIQFLPLQGGLMGDGIQHAWEVLYPGFDIIKNFSPFNRSGGLLGRIILENGEATFYDGLVLNIRNLHSNFTSQNYLSPTNCFLPFATGDYCRQSSSVFWCHITNEYKIEKTFEDEIRTYYDINLADSLNSQRIIKYNRSEHLIFALVDLMIRIGNMGWILNNLHQNPRGTSIEKDIFLQLSTGDIEFLDAFNILYETGFLLNRHTDVCKVNPLFEKNYFRVGFELAKKHNNNLEKKRKEEKISSHMYWASIVMLIVVFIQTVIVIANIFFQNKQETINNNNHYFPVPIIEYKYNKILPSR